MKPFALCPAVLAVGGAIATCAAPSVWAQVPSEFQVVSKMSLPD
ncbi:MAG TPA: hypothetical protein VIY90_22740 [Steroidobacteraceae bacterium]